MILQGMALLLMFCGIILVDGFLPLQSQESAKICLASNKKDQDVSFREQAEILLAKARELREETEDSAASATTPTTPDKGTTITAGTPQRLSRWNVDSSGNEASMGPGYRLYIDIGREEGTWMEPRWGASGNRIELTLDVEFSKEPADEKEAEKLVSDNMFGKKSSPYVLKSANVARLRQGFDNMKCDGGAYRIDTSDSRQTVRFYVSNEGTEDPSFGDINIPPGGLYFSLPCFGGNPSQLSAKEGIVTVRQIGWNTGWRREESRIVGVFYAKPIKEAIKRDGF